MFWDYPKKQAKKQAAADPVWRLERLIQYGSGTEKLSATLLRKHWKSLKIPSRKKAFLELLVWGKRF